jgi:hypothetical protein
MEDLIDLIATDSAASQVTSSIKDILFAKAAERVDALRPGVANSMFGEGETTDEHTEDQE